MNYRKLRIGAGNRINALVTLGGGSGGAPTAQGGSIQLRHVLLVSLPVPGTGQPRGSTAGGPSRADLRENPHERGHRSEGAPGHWQHHSSSTLQEPSGRWAEPWDMQQHSCVLRAPQAAGSALSNSRNRGWRKSS